MDQLKDFLKQCVKYRFWIAFGVSLILPIVGYFVGVGGIIQAKTTAEAAIKSAKADVSKYTNRGLVNGQYQPEAAKKNVALANDVDESWRKLRALQEPLLRWPEEVEEKFLRWGRKYPDDVDPGEVQRTLTDYTFYYPAFVSKIYKIFKPFNYEDGSGIVVAPDEKVLLRPVAFSPDAPPDLTKVWAEQERMWVVTALLNAIAQINETVKAINWEGAIVKQINLVEVGSQLDEDQKSLAEGVTLVPADILARAGAPAAPAAPPTGVLGAPGIPGGGPAGGSSQATDEVYYLKNDSKKFKTLPIKVVALVDQARLADFLVGLENSPITISVMEVEVARPAGSVTKPEIGERSSAGGAMGIRPGSGGPGGDDAAGGGTRVASRGGMPSGAARPPGGITPGGGARLGVGGPGGNASTKGGGVDARGINKAQQRKESNKDADKKADKIKNEQYLNIVEVTVYGQARFYLAPPPLPAGQPSTAAAPAAPASPPAQAEPAKPAAPAPVDAPKSEDTAKKDEAPKAETPAPKADEPKAEAPKAETPKPEAPKGDAPAPKS